jgi:hypothetical protein
MKAAHLERRNTGAIILLPLASTEIESKYGFNSHKTELASAAGWTTRPQWSPFLCQALRLLRRGPLQAKSWFRPMQSAHPSGGRGMEQGNRLWSRQGSDFLRISAPRITAVRASDFDLRTYFGPRISVFGLIFSFWPTTIRSVFKPLAVRMAWTVVPWVLAIRVKVSPDLTT